MPEEISNGAPHRGRTRYHFVVFWFAILLAAFSGLRLVLFLKFAPAGAAQHDLVNTFLIGLHRDAYVGLLLSLPLLFWFFILPNRWFVTTWHRLVFRFAFFIGWLFWELSQRRRYTASSRSNHIQCRHRHQLA